MIETLLIVAAFLAGHWTAPDHVSIVQVKVPVPIACQETVPDRPAMPTEEFQTEPTLDQFTQAALAELERRQGYEGQLRAALEACTAPIGSAP